MKSSLDSKFDREGGPSLSVSRYWIGLYCIDLTSNKGRVAWVIQHGMRVIAKGTSRADRAAFDVMRALSVHAEGQESKSDPR